MLMMRVYLPLIAIYLVDVGQVTVTQLGILAAVAAVTMLAVNVPTGYLADKWARKTAIIWGAVFLSIGAALYALFPSFAGAIAATVAESIGYSVISGAGEALIHDTLTAQKREHEYVKTLGRAQSMALTGNVVGIAVIPLTYAVHPRIPFLIGMALGLIFLYIATTLVEPPRPVHDAVGEPANMYRTLRVFVNRHTIVFFLVLGVLSASYKAYPPFTNLALQDLGFKPALLGFLFAAASVVGAINGRLIHVYKRLHLQAYALFDVCMSAMFLLVIGIFRNIWLASAVFIVNMGFWRIRSIMYQDQLLSRYKSSKRKATLVSTISFFESINFWLSPAIAFVIARHGLYNGLVYVGIALGLVVSAGITIGVRRLHRL